jgi:PadR family transcriptional regulator, regulatory protein PadR
MNTQLKKGVLELCVLSAVKSSESYGYELVETISRHIEISEGTIYPLLRRLTNERYFETYLVESTGGPPRKYYRLTAKGEKFREGLAAEWGRLVDGVSKLLHERGSR